MLGPATPNASMVEYQFIGRYAMPMLLSRLGYEEEQIRATSKRQRRQRKDGKRYSKRKK